MAVQEWRKENANFGDAPNFPFLKFVMLYRKKKDTRKMFSQRKCFVILFLCSHGHFGVNVKVFRTPKSYKFWMLSRVRK